MSEFRIIEGDCLDSLRTLPEQSVQTCVTSPPYWGLRDYGADGQLGLEPTPEEYVANMVAVFREVRRVLRDDGTLWLNLGDSYAGYWGDKTAKAKGERSSADTNGWTNGFNMNAKPNFHDAFDASGIKPKDLVGIPWMVAFALRADGWYLRSDIIWSKPNPMPESVTDRPTKAHEYLFLLTKSPRYFYDADAIREPHMGPMTERRLAVGLEQQGPKMEGRKEMGLQSKPTFGNGLNPAGRNKRTVWTVATQPFPGAHFATFPPKLIEPCILAGSPPKCCGHGWATGSPECGAPWQRVTVGAERVPVGHGGNAKPGNWDSSRGDHGTGTMYAMRGGVSEWRSTCEHDDDSGTATVLDPFNGAGTTGLVALRHNRNYIGCELNPEYAQMTRDRLYDDAPMLNVEAA